MSVKVNDNPGMLLSLDAAATTGAGKAFVLKRPLYHWSVTTLIAGGTESTVLFEGSVATSSDAPFTTIASYTAATSGATASTSFLAMQVRLTLDAQSSSAMTTSGWIAGAP